VSAEQAVRLYTLKQEVLYIHPGEPSLQVDRILLDESSRERLFLTDPGASFTRERLPVHVVALRIGELSERPFTPGPYKNCEELHYFAVEPALRRILEAPFREELRQAKWERDKMKVAKDQAKEEVKVMQGLINSFPSVPFYRRLWLAFRPHQLASTMADAYKAAVTRTP
jgi:hypothetical protein